MDVTRSDRRVVTFYSFKGGVGRTMALANLAFRLADRRDLDVIAVDWDLEAPGLHRFFGITDDEAATQRGLLDYLLAWREAVEDDAEAPPDATGWLVPVTAPRPARGSLRLLLAGRLDDGYADRLRGFDWLPFYRFDAGSAAIERLRAQLAAKADMVLVDSRTGVTDAGGICTVQMPDAVVLLTAANEQSFAGTQRVGRAIAAGEGERDGRPRPKVWVAISRAPYLDVREGEDWFDDHAGRFESGYTEGIWAQADHPRGVRSHRLPHVGRWGFGEQIIGEKAEEDDPLAMAYVALGDQILNWAMGQENLGGTLDTGIRRTLGELRCEISIARLPVTSRDLFGREAELAWLDRCWVEGVRVASIVAWGGVGKSALVNAWLARVRDEGWRGAARVYGWSFYSQGTDRPTSSDEFVDAALRWFGDTNPMLGSPWDKGERLAALVRKERTLLILDGVEPLQWGPGVQAGRMKDPALEALVKELGAQNKGLCLITSRIALADLEALAGDKVQAHDLDHLSPEAGAELLRARGVKGADDELREAAKEYDGHSFSLTLLGSYLRTAHKGDIRKRHHISPLAGKPAHRMMATYERWFEGQPEVAILRMLGLFDRPAPEDEIAVLRADPPIAGLTDGLAGLRESAWNEAVTALRDVGLLSAGADAASEDRLDAHPLVREHFGEQLKRVQPEAWREGHRRLYVYLKNKAKPRPDTADEMAPLYAAVVHGCLAGKNNEAFNQIFRERIQRKQEAYSTYHLGAFSADLAALSAFFDPPWTRLAPGLVDMDEARVLRATGLDLLALGELSEATSLLERALEKRDRGKAWRGAAKVAGNLSEVFQARGDLTRALEYAQISVDYADKDKSEVFWRVARRATLADVLLQLGHAAQAEAQIEEAEQVRRDEEPAAQVLFATQGFTYSSLMLDKELGPEARTTEIRAKAQQTLEDDKKRGWLLETALDLLSLGCIHLEDVRRGAEGNLSAAATYIDEGVKGLRRAGRRDHLPLGLLARAALHTYTRAFDLARKDLDEALTLSTRCGFRLHEADAHLGLARLSLAEGDPARALDHLAAARKIIDETGYHRRDQALAALESSAREMARSAGSVMHGTHVPG